MDARPVWRATKEMDDFIMEVFRARKGVININTVFNVDRDPQLWWSIPGFNGYEMSDYGFVRSMKYFQRCPFGMLIKFDSKGYYILSDNNNDRIKIHRKELWDLVISNPYSPQPRRTCQTDCYSRNKRMFLCDQDLPIHGTRGYGVNSKGRIKKKHVPTNKKEPTFFPQFTIIPDGGIDVLEFYDKEN